MSGSKFATITTSGILLLSCLIGRIEGAVYYVSVNGDDRNSGLSPDAAWRSLEKVSESNFLPGNQILLEGGQSFEGPVKFDHYDAGSSEDPIVLSSYGLDENGPATINSETRGIELYNASGFLISDLNIVGDGADGNSTSGILMLSTRDEGAADITIDRVEVSRFGRHGISIGAWETQTGFRNVRITRTTTHNNHRAGIVSWGPWGKGIYAHRNVYIGDSEAYKMKGGSGMVLSSVDGGIIERSIAHNNGEEYSGGAGIWAWDSNDILFQFNESYENRTTGVDGDGFDFDGGVTNSIMQYNYSHDNDAAGYLLAQYAHAPQAMENIIIRYNISENDCRKRNYGAIHVWKAEERDVIRNVQIYQNTVYLNAPPRQEPRITPDRELAGILLSPEAPAPRKPHGSAISIISPTTSVSVYNNLFYTSGGSTLVSVVEGQEEIHFQNNAYWSGEEPFRVEWMGVKHRSLTAWLDAAADQERMGSKILAINADPMLKAPGTGGTIRNADLFNTLTGYKLRADSPLVGRGIPLSSTFGIDPGAKGFFGDPICNTTPPAIGAHVAYDAIEVADNVP